MDTVQWKDSQGLVVYSHSGSMYDSSSSGITGKTVHVVRCLAEACITRTNAL